MLEKGMYGSTETLDEVKRIAEMQHAYMEERFSLQAYEPLSMVALQIESALGARGVRLDKRSYGNLLAKLVEYCTMHRWFTPRAVWQMENMAEPFADLVAGDQGVLDGDINFDRLLDTRPYNMQRAEEMLRRWKGPVIPRTVLYQTCDPCYRLEESTTPAHLMEDSVALGHCGGTSLNYMALQQKNLLEYDPRAPHYLRFAIKIRGPKKEMRLFSLTGPSGPAVSIGYQVKDENIAEMEGYDPVTHGDEPFFPALCDALGYLSREMRIYKIMNGLPPPPDARHTILTRSHGWVSEEEALRRIDSDDVLVGLADFSGFGGSTEKKILAAHPRVYDIRRHDNFLHAPPWMEKTEDAHPAPASGAWPLKPAWLARRGRLARPGCD